MTFEELTNREWLESNGMGGFASGTASGVHTRRYHGLLVAAARPPVGRMLLLSKFEETLETDSGRFELGANQYPGVAHPKGYEWLVEFSCDPTPRFVFDAGGVRIEKRVLMIHGENTVVVEYTARGHGAGAALELRPLIAFRDYHSTTHSNGAINRTVQIEPDRVRLAPYGDLPALYLSHNGAAVSVSGDWYFDFEYAIEKARGLDFREDLFQPCVLRFDLSANSRAVVVASLEPRLATLATPMIKQETARRASLCQGTAAAAAADPVECALAKAADQFIVTRGSHKSVLAGFPWFTDWGRDAMISLPGLTLATGRFDDARSVLLAFAQAMTRGVLPNRFPDAGETAEYNTVDATLWFFEALRAYVAATGDFGVVRDHLFELLEESIEWHVRGTWHGIQMDDDGLLQAGEAGVQLTWMDAKVGDWVVTPRHGKPVEIQALWYNALCVMRGFAAQHGLDARQAHYDRMAKQARESFNGAFWNEATGCLLDCVEPQGVRDGAIRPNQLVAMSLEHPVLDQARWAGVIRVAREHLLTPYGLRTLSPMDRDYRGRFEGGPRERDGAYHQGTVWPWLMGPFASAYFKAEGFSACAREQVREWIAPLERMALERGQLPEVFDGDAPHRAGGCFAQAWSVAELLRVRAELRRPLP